MGGAVGAAGGGGVNVTVGEVIEALFEFPLDLNVYIPDSRDGTAQIAQQVCGLVHLNGIEGVNIPDDVTITPWIGDLQPKEET